MTPRELLWLPLSDKIICILCFKAVGFLHTNYIGILRLKSEKPWPKEYRLKKRLGLNRSDDPCTDESRPTKGYVRESVESFFAGWRRQLI